MKHLYIKPLMVFHFLGSGMPRAVSFAAKSGAQAYRSPFCFVWALKRSPNPLPGGWLAQLSQRVLLQFLFREHPETQLRVEASVEAVVLPLPLGSTLVPLWRQLDFCRDKHCRAFGGSRNTGCYGPGFIKTFIWRLCLPK